MKEADYENAILELFENMGYEKSNGADIQRDYKNPILEDILEESLSKINKHLSKKAIDEAIYKLTNFENNSLEQKNQLFMSYLQNGITVKYLHNEEKNEVCYLIDYKNIKNNSFDVINQFTFIEDIEKRPDIMVFINGLPLFLIELKPPSRENTTTSEVYRQIRNYLNEEIKQYEKSNLVKSELFSEKVKKIMNSYINGLISNEEVIEELIKLSKEIIALKDEAKKFGFTQEELDFYDALTKPQAVKDFYEKKIKN